MCISLRLQDATENLRISADDEKEQRLPPVSGEQPSQIPQEAPDVSVTSAAEPEPEADTGGGARSESPVSNHDVGNTKHGYNWKLLYIFQLLSTWYSRFCSMWQ